MTSPSSSSSPIRPPTRWTCPRRAGRVYREQAWAFIPRKRQDRQRPLPMSWELGSGLALAVVLAVALLLATFRLDQPDVSVQVREFTFGMGAAAGLLVMVDFAAKLLGSRGPALRRVLYPLPGVLAVAGSLAVAYGVLFGSAGPDEPATVLWGAAAMLVARAGVGIWCRPRRPSSRAVAGSRSRSAAACQVATDQQPPRSTRRHGGGGGQRAGVAVDPDQPPGDTDPTGQLLEGGSFAAAKVEDPERRARPSARPGADGAPATQPKDPRARSALPLLAPILTSITALSRVVARSGDWSGAAVAVLALVSHHSRR
jgi:hypothetical protein